ncbi:hypothetical protein [Streptomyces tauricus]|uniref:hypothetical protein n=1 Tax=Streptomyces tauricus TaxID=68274 RepID=UPI002243AA3C|nr:hypothetical protein [Streptomyces tauricus]MCW8096895.1 hypothetical protein [Streptomyces tauricus]
MSEEEADSQILGRKFLPIATGRYDSPDWRTLPVEEEVRALRAWLCAADLDDRSFAELRALAVNPDRHQIRAVLENVPWGTSEAAFVYVTGHGEYADGAHWIVLKQTVPGQWHRTAIRTSDVVGWLKDSGTEHLLLVLDLCYAGRVMAETAVFDDDIPPTWLVLPSAAKDEEAAPEALTEAVSAVLADLASPRGERFGRHNRLLNVETFLEELDEELGERQRLIPLAGSQLRGPHPCLPNPHYRPEELDHLSRARRDLALPQADVDAHWGPRARGVAEDSAPGWLFTGRAPLMRELLVRLLKESGTVMVTGGAGTGKSAVLARLVTLADPVFLAAHRAHVDTIPSDLRPPPESIDVAVLATGKTALEIAQQISGALGVTLRTNIGADPHLKQWVVDWQKWLGQRKERVVLVIDAIEEADDPTALVRDLLGKLHIAEWDQLHLLLGVRSPGRSERTAAASPGRHDTSLADRVAQQLGARRLRLDEEPWFDEADLTAYATHILTKTPGSPYAPGASRTSATAKALAAHAKGSFLVTRIAAASLTRKSHQVAPDNPDWLSAVDDGVRGVFSADLHQLLHHSRERQRAVQVLRALAFARGNGLPWNRIWPAVADAVAGDPDVTFGDSDIAGLLASPLGGYLTVDIADDTTVYRLFHDALRTTLRDHWRELSGIAAPSVPDTPDETCRAEARIAKALAYVAHHTLDSARAAQVAPYIRRHLAEHADAGAVLNDRVLSPRLLPYLDIARLRSLLNTASAATDLSMATALRRLTHLWDFDRPEENATALALCAAALQTPVPDGATDSPWQVRVAHWPLSSSEIIGRHSGSVRAAVGLVLPDARAVAVTAGVDDTVRVWDLATGQPARPHLIGDGGAMALSGVVRPDGQAIVLVTDSAGTLKAFNLSDGQLAFPPVPGHGESPVAGLVLPDGRTLVLTRGAGATTQVWDLDEGRAVLPRLKGHRGTVRAVAGLVLPGGRALALSGGDGGVVRAWDLADGKQVTLPLNSRQWATTALAGLALPDGRTLAFAGSGSGSVLVWDLDTGQTVLPPLSGHRSRVMALSGVVLPDGRALAVAGGADGTVRVWDLADGRPALPPLAEQQAEVRALSGVVLPDGRALAVAGGADGTVRVWDLADGRPATPPLVEQQEDVCALSGVVLPDGRALAFTGERSGTVRVWDLADARLALPPRRDHSGRGMQALAGLVLPDGRALGLSCDGDGVVWAWDPVTGRHAGQFWTDHHLGRVHSMAGLALPDGRIRVFTVGDREVLVWDQPTGQRVQTMPRHWVRGTALAGLVLPDGRAVVVSCGRKGTLRWTGLTEGAPSEKIDMEGSHDVSSLAGAVLPDGRALVLTGEADGTVRIWDLEKGQPVGSVIHAPGAVIALSATVLDQGRLAVLVGGEGLACVITADL